MSADRRYMMYTTPTDAGPFLVRRPFGCNCGSTLFMKLDEQACRLLDEQAYGCDACGMAWGSAMCEIVEMPARRSA